jgi:hypothetical protein
METNEAASAAPVLAIDQGTKVKTICSLSDSQRLTAARKGIALDAGGKLVVELPLDAPLLSGMKEKTGEATWDVSYFYGSTQKIENILIEAVLAGTDPIAALAAFRDHIETSEAKRLEAAAKDEAQRLAHEAAQRKAVETAGYTWQPSLVFSSDTPEDAVRRFRNAEEKTERDAEEKVKREAEDKVKAEWIFAHGSDALKERHKRGYDCQRRYMEERVKMELPEGWVLAKWDGLGNWELKDRTDPSDEALALEKDMEKRGFMAKVKWAEWEHGESCDEYCGEVHKGEVVLIEDFHEYQIYYKTLVE